MDVESWMTSSYNLEEIAGFAQLFVLKSTQKEPILFVAKVVDGLLLAGTSAKIHRFHDALSAKYKVGLFNPHPPFVLNRLHIEMNENGDVKASMEEFMDTISPMDIPRTRRKQKRRQRHQ